MVIGAKRTSHIYQTLTWLLFDFHADDQFDSKKKQHESPKSQPSALKEK